MSFQDTISNEQLSLEQITADTPISELVHLFKSWDSCALKAVENFYPNTSIYLTAVEHNLIAAKKIFDQACLNNWIYVLVKCANHLELATQLKAHPHPVVRTMCSKHHQLALELIKDSNEYVRNACCQWMDILESHLADPSRMVRIRQIENSLKMAEHYFVNGSEEDRSIVIRLWGKNVLNKEAAQ